MFHLQLLGTLQLVASDGAVVRPVLMQPKRLALLAYLTVGAPDGVYRRDALLALFWPESTEAEARRALRQALHYLRRLLGHTVIANCGNGQIALTPDALWCDVVAFRRAMEAGEAERALALYRGDLLTGFSIAGISLELERWLEEERAALRARAASAAAQLCRRAGDAGNLATAIDWARRELALSCDDEPVLRRLVRLLDRQGNRAAALREVQEFARRTMAELCVEPAAETKALVDEIRLRAEAHPVVEPLPFEPATDARGSMSDHPAAPDENGVPRTMTVQPTPTVQPERGSTMPARHRTHTLHIGGLVILLVVSGIGATVARLLDGRHGG